MGFLTRTGSSAKLEQAAAFEEELALFRELQVEARQVHLLLVDFNLREVGVVGEVERQVLRQVVLGVEAKISINVVQDRRRPPGPK
jgi:hypothetical protein